MKKLFLLPLLTLTLAGCGKYGTTNENWETLKENHILTVYVGSSYYNYNPALDGSVVKYCSFYSETPTVFTIKVERTVSDTTLLDVYYGTNISYSIQQLKK